MVDAKIVESHYSLLMRLVVTGGFGFIGSHFVELALSLGHEVIIIDKLTYSGNTLNLENISKDSYRFIEMDISEFDSLLAALNDLTPIDCVINFAAESHVDRSILNSAPFISSNIKGVANLLDALKLGKFTKLIQISTDEVYGTISHGSWDESFPINPRSPYSASKASGDMLCIAYKNTFGLDITITRCSNNYGPRQCVEKFIPNSICSILDGMEIPIYGDGSNRREWLHVSDHVSAIIKLVEASQIKHSIYNIGGSEFSNLEIARMITDYLMVKNDSIIFVPDRQGHDFRYSVNHELFASEFNWQPKYELFGGLQETIEWYVSNPVWIKSSKDRILK
jgi:dTDP-glucose 4,6-dehydratase